MKKPVPPALAAVFLTVGAVNAETTGKTVGWADLIDQTAQSFEDPFLALTADQLESLRTIVFSRAKPESEDVAGEKRLELPEKTGDAQAELSQSGVDADRLISQRWLVRERRENAANAGNPAIDGQSATLSGFVIPAPTDADGSVLVYLVPERGMCGYLPPPRSQPDGQGAPDRRMAALVRVRTRPLDRQGVDRPVPENGPRR